MRRWDISSAGHSRPGAAMIVLLLAACSCSLPRQEATGEPPAPPPLNVVVVADMSDRIAVPGQVARDTAIIRIVCNAFQEHARQVGYPFSRDRLRFQAVRTTLLDNDVLVDVGDMNDRHEIVVRHLAERLQQFQRDCAFGYVAQDSYPGADLWGYFKDGFPAVVERAPFQNRVILLTDGYLSFEGAIQAKRPRNTEMNVAELRDKADWQVSFRDMALKGVGQRFPNTQMMILEVAPKLQPESVHEFDIIRRYWTEWCDSLGIDAGAERPRIFTNNLQLSAIRDKLREFLSSGGQAVQ
jgi:hypothetical protein